MIDFFWHYWFCWVLWLLLMFFTFCRVCCFHFVISFDIVYVFNLCFFIFVAFFEVSWILWVVDCFCFLPYFDFLEFVHVLDFCWFCWKLICQYFWVSRATFDVRIGLVGPLCFRMKHSKSNFDLSHVSLIFWSRCLRCLRCLSCSRFSRCSRS